MADSFGFCKHQLSLEVACRSPAPRQKARPSFSRSRRRNWLPQKIMGFNRKNGPKSEGFGVPVLGNHHFEIAQLLRKKHKVTGVVSGIICWKLYKPAPAGAPR